MKQEETLSAHDFARLEQKLNDCVELLSDLLGSRAAGNQTTVQILKVDDVERLYGLSPYLQREARRSGKLKYIVSGRREITYSRSALEAFLRSRTLN
ncbi:hypothetical protein C7T94_02260 [Pedobacter yulinensis]|uniref:DNA-binding protein n=1 Tax=Pedobacter yulinensis TaxID=2126353 RepID=A0A2T3HR79_9SPHI|nr:DNA-binding protein [Pedobacter yulinensis]PST84964.1 hypothetical protein C7T94_02260 [Pedobacter yulinensis]